MEERSSILKLPEEEWPQESASTGEDLREDNAERRKVKIVCEVTSSKAEEVINQKKISSWRRLIRVTAHIRRLKRKARARRQAKGGQDNHSLPTQGPLLPAELHESEIFWIKEAQKSLHSRVKKGEFRALSPFLDEKGVLRVGGRVSEAVVSYESKHPALLPHKHWLSLSITRHMHQFGHNGVATTTAKTKRKYWILKANDLAKSVKYRCVFCREMAHKVETQRMADLPKLRLAPHTPPFHYTACDYFGPYTVKVGRSKTTKHYGVLFTHLS